jgi:hypothetical protein
MVPHFNSLLLSGPLPPAAAITPTTVEESASSAGAGVPAGGERDGPRVASASSLAAKANLVLSLLLAHLLLTLSSSVATVVAVGVGVATARCSTTGVVGGRKTTKEEGKHEGGGSRELVVTGTNFDGLKSSCSALMPSSASTRPQFSVPAGL